MVIVTDHIRGCFTRQGTVGEREEAKDKNDSVGGNGSLPFLRVLPACFLRTSAHLC